MSHFMALYPRLSQTFGCNWYWYGTTTTTGWLAVMTSMMMSSFTATRCHRVYFDELQQQHGDSSKWKKVWSPQRGVAVELADSDAQYNIYSAAHIHGYRTFNSTSVDVVLDRQLCISSNDTAIAASQLHDSAAVESPRRHDV